MTPLIYNEFGIQYYARYVYSALTENDVNDNFIKTESNITLKFAFKSIFIGDFLISALALKELKY